MKGQFIVFEGIDGSGKGTLIACLEKFLLKKGLEKETIVHTAEPTSGFYGKKVRELLALSVDPQVNARQFLDLYVADRKEHVQKVLEPAMRAGKIILCDRYKYSTFVYQGLQEIPAGKISALHVGMPVPDIVFILDIPVDVALQRINGDKKRRQLEAFEKKDFLEKVRASFLQIKKTFPAENIIILDSSKSEEELCKKAGEIVWKRINK
ncbi:MAG TPA: dTMP kinase [archaeon]|nr:dTMP kinase [archaeon]